MDQIVELELIDLAGVELTEPVPHVLQQTPKLLLVIGRHRRACRPALRLVVRIRPLGHHGDATPETEASRREGAV